MGNEAFQNASLVTGTRITVVSELYVFAGVNCISLDPGRILLEQTKFHCTRLESAGPDKILLD